MTDANVCACGQPAPDAAICPGCTNKLRADLEALPAAWAELETKLAGMKGVDYRGKGGSRSSERPLPIDRAAYELREDIKATLASWAALITEGAS